MSQLTLNYIAPPTNQMAHLLYEMIQGKMISERMFEYNRFRGSISDLINDFSVPVHHTDVPFENTFGRKSTYRKHYILNIDRERAIEIYERVNNNSRINN